MSAFSRPAGIRTVVRQFAVAVTLCTAVAIPAALVADSDASTSAPTASTSSPEDNVWPAPPVSPTPVAPVN